MPGISDVQGKRITISINGDQEAGKANQAYANLNDIGQDAVAFSQGKPQRGFSVLRATGRFLQGAVSDTLNSIFSVKGALTIGASALAVGTFGWPALAVLGGLGLVAGGSTLIGGISKAVRRYNEGDTKGAENAFREIGNGALSTALSFTALKGLKIKGTEIFSQFKGADGKFVGVRGALKSLGNVFMDGSKRLFGFKKFSDPHAPVVAEMAEAAGSHAKGSIPRLGAFFRSFVRGKDHVIKVPDATRAQAMTEVGWAGVKARFTDGTLIHGASIRNRYDLNEAELLKDRLDSL